jgi:hypothetical protein
MTAPLWLIAKITSGGTSRNVRLGRTNIAFTTINDALFGLENIIVCVAIAMRSVAVNGVHRLG